MLGKLLQLMLWQQIFPHQPFLYLAPGVVACEQTASSYDTPVNSARSYIITRLQAKSPRETCLMVCSFATIPW